MLLPRPLRSVSSCYIVCTQPFPGALTANDVGDISKYGTGDASHVDKINSYAKIIGLGEGQLPA